MLPQCTFSLKTKCKYAPVSKHHIMKMYAYKGHKSTFHTFKTAAMDGTGLLRTPTTIPPEKDLLKSFLK